MMEYEWGPQLRLPTDDSPKTLTAATLIHLRNDIVAGRLEPGQKLRIQELTHNYNVGSSPLREALFQLASDGFVRVSGQRGFRVAELSLADLEDIIEWRIHNECEALRRSCENRTVEWEGELIAALHKLKAIEEDDELDDETAGDLWEEQHRVFHFTLYNRCGSAWLLRFCELLSEHGERYRRAFVEYQNIDPQIFVEHKEILDAVLAKKTDKAVVILERHIQHAARLATNFLSANNSE